VRYTIDLETATDALSVWRPEIRSSKYLVAHTTTYALILGIYINNNESAPEGSYYWGDNLRLHRTPSLHGRKWRNEENENWANIEKTYQSIQGLEDFLEGFDGNQLIKKSYNLFNKEMVTEGQIVPSTGAIGSGNYWVTDYIEVVPG